MGKDLTIFDNVWGEIRLDFRYAQILNLFPELKQKQQLGL